MAAEGATAAAARAAAAPPPPTLLSLPDETLTKLFELLSARPGVALSRDARDAHALAAAHPRLDRLFRHELVTRLVLYYVFYDRRRPVQVDALASEVQRVLQRHPRATELSLFAHGTDVDVAACVAPRLTVIDVESVDLSSDGTGVRALLAQCLGLEELMLVKCEPALGDEELGAIVSAAASRLRVLSLKESAKEVTDAGGARLRDLTVLTNLNLWGCPGVGPATLLSVAVLPALASLCLAFTKFSAEDAVATLPRMRALRNLDVSSCDAVGPWLWAALPPTLRVLRADSTALLQGAPEEPCTATLAELHAEHLRDGHVNWAALAGPHARALRVWKGTDSDLCDLDDGSADAALQAMPQLESLDLSYCSVGDGIAAAVARHPALRFVDFRRTSVGPAGVRALRRWEEDGYTVAVRGEDTDAGRSFCKRRAVIAKRRALLDA